MVIIGGPNGAGKTTISRAVIHETLGLAEFVNADIIAQGLSGFDPDRAALQAGRVMLTRLRELAAARSSFAFETTMASRTFVPWLMDLRKGAGCYEVHLVFVWLRSPDLAVERMHARVRSGGHFVPPDVVRRRYRRGIWNLINLYLPVADAWRVYDNSSSSGGRLVARGEGDQTVIHDRAVWNSIHEIAAKTEAPDNH